MSVPVSKHWFSLSIRRNRQSYILAVLALTAVFSAVIIALGFFGVGWTRFMTIMWWFVVPYLICGCLLTSQRLRDFGVPGGLALLWVPLAFAGGDIGAAAALIFSWFCVPCPERPGTTVMVLTPWRKVRSSTTLLSVVAIAERDGRRKRAVLQDGPFCFAAQPLRSAASFCGALKRQASSRRSDSSSSEMASSRISTAG